MWYNSCTTSQPTTHLSPLLHLMLSAMLLQVLLLVASTAFSGSQSSCSKYQDAARQAFCRQVLASLAASTGGGQDGAGEEEQYGQGGGPWYNQQQHGSAPDPDTPGQEEYPPSQQRPFYGHPWIQPANPPDLNFTGANELVLQLQTSTAGLTGQLTQDDFDLSGEGQRSGNVVVTGQLAACVHHL